MLYDSIASMIAKSQMAPARPSSITSPARVSTPAFHPASPNSPMYFTGRPLPNPSLIQALIDSKSLICGISGGILANPSFNSHVTNLVYTKVTDSMESNLPKVLQRTLEEREPELQRFVSKSIHTAVGSNARLAAATVNLTGN